MRMNKEYSQAVTQAKENLTDLNERGAEAVGGNVLEFMESILKKDEIVESVTRPRQHRHLKRKDSIRFSVLLVFSNFYIYTGCRKGTSSRPPHPRKDLFKSS